MRSVLFLLLPLAGACAQAPSDDDAAGGGGKADGWGKKIEVAVEQCGGDPQDLCPYVTSASCGLVTLHDAHDKEIASAYTNENGRVTFADLDNGSYSVKVHQRGGSLAEMRIGDFSTTTAPAKVKAKLESGGETPWARFELQPGQGEKIDSCADMRGNVTVVDAAGDPMDREAVEWRWFVELETDGEVRDDDRNRLVFVSNSNIIRFLDARVGTHTLRFVPMDIPSYLQKPNPDYARLRRLYSDDSIPPVEVSIEVKESDVAHEMDLSQKLTDPR